MTYMCSYVAYSSTGFFVHNHIMHVFVIHVSASTTFLWCKYNNNFFIVIWNRNVGTKGASNIGSTELHFASGLYLFCMLKSSITYFQKKNEWLDFCSDYRLSVKVRLWCRDTVTAQSLPQRVCVRGRSRFTLSLAVPEIFFSEENISF